MSSPDALAYYAAPGRFTTLDDDEWRSADVAEVVAAVQQLLIYDTVCEPFYGVTLSEVQAGTINERYAAAVLRTAQQVDPTPIGQQRDPSRRVGGRCHLFTKLTVSFLRAAGVPARSRCGFGTQFNPGWHEDHWVAEYWHAATNEWRMADAQLDSTWREMIGYTGNHLHVPATEFVSAGHAWQAWRRGELDADRCGLSAINEHGAFWIAGNLRLDLAALNKVEMNPWDIWGAGLEPGEEPSAEALALFDSVAELTVAPDEHFDDLQAMYDTNDQLRMPGEVFSVNLNRVEQV